VNQFALAPAYPPIPGPGMIETTLRRIGIPAPAILRQPAVRRALPLLLGLIVLAAIVAIALSLRAPNRTTIFPGLGDADKAAIVDALKTGGFDVAIDRDTGDVQVPADALYRARIALAAAGLPKAVPGGYDLLANMPLGASRALERARLKQADEGELARAIGAMGGVASARVLLALPDPSPFVRDSVPPSASVFVTLSPGRALGEAQVHAVQHLVASSVPGLPPERVSVVDGAGTLLSGEPDEGDLGPSAKQIAYQSKLERQYRDRIAALLGPVLGPGNFSAEVHADLDFTDTQATTETYAPGGSVIRSEATTARSDASPPARGIPGAVSNIAPPAPTVGSTPPAQAAAANGAPPGSGPGSAPLSSETSATRTYEVGKSVAVTRQPVGQVKRLAVAVVIRDAPGAGGARAPDLKTLQLLVATAVGIDPKRGDLVSVVREPFVTPLAEPEPPLWRTLASEHGGHLVGLVAVIAAALLARPLLRRAPVGASQPAPGTAGAHSGAALATAAPVPGEHAAADALASALPNDLALAGDERHRRQPNAADILSSANSYDDKIAAIRLFVTEDPARATSVFKQMLAPKANG
jgi:flagellar M-ring protein FliF